MTPEKFRDLLDRYSRAECTEKERKYVDEWFNNIESSDTSAPLNTEEKLWMKIKPSHIAKAKNQTAFYLKIAASLTLIIAVAVWTMLESFPLKSVVKYANNSEVLTPADIVTEIRNDSDAPRVITLDDGSSVTLQPGGRLKIPETFAPSERIVSLVGEAFFNIRRDTLRPFFVYSGEVVTKVLGTSFNIKALDAEKEITVAVKTGKVSVFTNPKIKVSDASEVILTPNQQAVYDRKEIVVTKELVEKPEIILDKPTIFKMRYHDTPVSEIFDVLEENYGVQIDYQGDQFKNCVLTTSMSDEGLFERVAVICKAIGATYRLEDAVIKIEGPGCQ
jgi:ferric-dicitrate binding protein FerR (iron transport regulator)